MPHIPALVLMEKKATLGPAAGGAKYPPDMGFHVAGSGAERKPAWFDAYRSVRHRLELHARAERSEIRELLRDLGADASEQLDRYRGALLGLALGDALGMPVEFVARGQKRVEGLEAGGRFSLARGEWTDETSMACCLAYSLLKSNGFNARHQMECYAHWYRFGAYSSNAARGCIDISASVREALDVYLSTGEPFAGARDTQRPSNASLVRIAPVPLFYFGAFDNAVCYAEQSSRTTHQAREAIDACRYLAALIYGALQGVDKRTLLARPYAPSADYWERAPLCPSIERIAYAQYRAKTRQQIVATAYVVDTLQAALWAFDRTRDFRSGLLEAVNLGGDADAVGAVYGQLAGAYYGEMSLPFDWLQKLHCVHGFYQFAEDLYAANRRNAF